MSGKILVRLILGKKTKNSFFHRFWLKNYIFFNHINMIKRNTIFEPKTVKEYLFHFNINVKFLVIERN